MNIGSMYTIRYQLHEDSAERMFATHEAHIVHNCTFHTHAYTSYQMSSHI